jgi:hypothetical protein
MQIFSRNTFYLAIAAIVFGAALFYTYTGELPIGWGILSCGIPLVAILLIVLKKEDVPK